MLPRSIFAPAGLLGLIILSGVLVSTVIADGAGRSFDRLTATPVSAIPTSSPDALPPDKQADLDRTDAGFAAAQKANDAAGITKDKVPGPPAPGSGDTGTILVPHTPAGAGVIFETTEPTPGSDVPITNAWFEKTSTGDFVSVYSGRDPANVSVGLILVTRGVPGDLTRFAAPGGHGALKITGAVKDVLALRAADGTTLHFDVAALSFR